MKEHFFGAFLYGAHFLYAEVEYMNNNDIPKKIIDITGVELTPGEPADCLGNGEQGFECCCDECDYFLLCFPEFDSKSETINKTEPPRPYYDKSNVKALLTLAYQKPMRLPSGR